MISDFDRKIFDQYIWPHADTVLRTAQFLLRDPGAAEDLAQETFVKAIRFIDKFEPGSDGRAWILTILRNTRIDMLRKDKRELTPLSLDALDHEPTAPAEPALTSPVMTVAEAEQLLHEFSDDALIVSLRSLPEEIRWTLLLVDVEGLDHRKAAEILKVPEGTVKSRAHRGRAMLKKLLLPLASERQTATSLQ